MAEGAAQTARQRAPAIAAAGALLAWLLATDALGRLGSGEPFGVGVGTVLPRMLRGLGVAVVFLWASYGLGVIGRPLLRGSADAPLLRLGVGLAAMLTAWHAAAAVGFAHAPAAWVLAGAGLGCAAVFREPTAHAAPQRVRGLAWALLAPIVGAAALLSVAATNPPGALWESEFGSYDALSYHLRLPQEWLASGRIFPAEHNVYSFLPGYLEAAFAQLGGLTLAPAAAAEGAGAVGLLAGTGWRALLPQWLHLAMGVLTAVTIARLVRRLAESCGARASAGGLAAGAIFLATPWVIVVGSIAYNELGVALLGSLALLAAADRRLSWARRGGLCGLLVGVACCVKPTAMLLIAPSAAALLVWSWARREERPSRGLGAAALACGVAGVLALSPWFVRNAAATGNPAFPFAVGVFGTGHWTEEQAERWSRGHSADGGLAERVRLAAWSDPDAPPDAAEVRRWRGMANPQWALFWPAAGAALAALSVRRETRGLAAVLVAAAGVSLAGWLAVTHIQSRFLIPLAVPACAAIGVAACRSRLAIALAGGLAAAQLAQSVRIFASEDGGNPNALLLAEPGLLRGYSPEPGFDAERWGEVSPPGWVRRNLPEGARLVLIGEAGAFYHEVGVAYATTWDTPPWLAAWRRSAERGTPFAVELRADGFTHALIAWGELQRLAESGYLPAGVSAGSLDTRGLVELHRWPPHGSAVYALGGAGR